MHLEPISLWQEYLSNLLNEECAREKAHDYESYHAERFDFVVQTCLSIEPRESAVVMDVGRSALSARLLEHYETVYTLGFPLSPSELHGHESGSTLDKGSERHFSGHVVYNLNDAQSIKTIETDQRFDLIVFAEVIEHLYTAPELTLYALRQVMKPGGHLVVQTPNAAALHKRLQLLLGRHPYERIRINNENPGHFREYTKRDLIEVASTARLDVVEHQFKDYFGVNAGFGKRVAGHVYGLVARIIPSFARGQTVILRRP